jgi:hypothetical protein
MYLTVASPTAGVSALVRLRDADRRRRADNIKPTDLRGGRPGKKSAREDGKNAANKHGSAPDGANRD